MGDLCLGAEPEKLPIVFYSLFLILKKQYNINERTIYSCREKISSKLKISWLNDAPELKCLEKARFQDMLSTMNNFQYKLILVLTRVQKPFSIIRF